MHQKIDNLLSENYFFTFFPTRKRLNSAPQLNIAKNDCSMGSRRPKVGTQEILQI